MICTYLLDIRALPDPLEYQETLFLCSKKRREKILRQKQPAARRQNLGAGLLLRYAMRQAGRWDTDGLRYNYYGKPYLEHPPFTPFNLSHSGDFAILSMPVQPQPADMLPSGGLPQPVDVPPSGGLPQPVDVPQAGDVPPSSGQLQPGAMHIGCDIERIQKYNPKIAARFFTKTEYHTLESQQQPERQRELFFRYWTRKESVLKLAGTGIVLPMDVFDVSRGAQADVNFERLETWRRTAQGAGGPEREEAFYILRGKELYLKEYRIDGYCIAVCSTYHDFTDHMAVVRPADLW